MFCRVLCLSVVVLLATSCDKIRHFKSKPPATSATGTATSVNTAPVGKGPAPGSPVKAPLPTPQAIVIPGADRPYSGPPTIYTIPDVPAGTPMESYGFKKGDVVLSVDGILVNSPQGVQALNDRMIGSAPATVEVDRAGQKVTLHIRTPK